MLEVCLGGELWTILRDRYPKGREGEGGRGRERGKEGEGGRGREGEGEGGRGEGGEGEGREGRERGGGGRGVCVNSVLKLRERGGVSCVNSRGRGC